MSNRIVYLAGPINNCTKGEANDWRDYASARLASSRITGISPLRCEPLVGERYGTDYPDPRFGTPSAIASKNRFDVANCDMMLAYFPHEEEASTAVCGIYKWPSVGTIWELGMARMAGKMVIVVCQNIILAKHPVIRTADWLLTDLDEGLDVAVGVLQDYAEGNLIQRRMDDVITH